MLKKEKNCDNIQVDTKISSHASYSTNDESARAVKPVSPEAIVSGKSRHSHLCWTSKKRYFSVGHSSNFEHETIRNCTASSKCFQQSQLLWKCAHKQTNKLNNKTSEMCISISIFCKRFCTWAGRKIHLFYIYDRCLDFVCVSSVWRLNTISRLKWIYFLCDHLFISSMQFQRLHFNALNQRLNFNRFLFSEIKHHKLSLGCSVLAKFNDHLCIYNW